MIQIFGTKKCKDTQKALRFFKERNIDIQFRDIDVKPPSPGELDDMASSAGFAALIDTDGPAAKKMGLSFMDYDERETLLLHPDLYKTPLIRPGKGKVLAGFDEKALKDALAVKSG